MADEHWKHANLMYGSAGMAASGMLPKNEIKPPANTPEPEPEVDIAPQEPQSIVAPPLEVAPEPDTNAEIEVIPVAPEPLTKTDLQPLMAPAEESVEEDAISEMATEPVAQIVAPIVQPAPVEATVEPSPIAPDDQALEVSAPEEKVEFIEAVTLTGYGVNAKADGLFADLKVAILGAGEHLIDQANWDHIFQGIGGLKVVGVSDQNQANLQRLQSLHDTQSAYSDYRELLARCKPDLAVLPQTGTKHRYHTIKNCLMTGANVICPAPFTRSLDQAEELLALADRRGLKIAVVNSMRLDPNIQRFFQSKDSILGELLEIRVFGAMDETSGGEDLLRHGTPLFDLVRMFAGNVVWCSSNILTKGIRSTREHVVDQPDSLWGPTIGDTVYAEMFTERNVCVSFKSNAKMRDITGGWGMEFIGSHNSMRLFAGEQPVLSLMQNPGEQMPTSQDHWQLWPVAPDPYHPVIDGLEGPDAALRLVVTDWLRGVTEDRHPESSAMRANKALEISHAIFQSNLAGGKRLYLPLANRHHPLESDLDVDFRVSA